MHVKATALGGVTGALIAFGMQPWMFTYPTAAFVILATLAAVGLRVTLAR